MRQPIYKGDFLSAFGYALGNSIGAYIGIKYSLSAWWNFVSIMFFCFGIGMIFDWAVEKIEYRRGSVTWRNILVVGIIFLLFEFLAYYYLRYDMTDDFYENILWVFGYGFLAFFVKKIWLYCKIFRARNKYGDGAQGYDDYSHSINFTQNTDYIFNKEIAGEYDKDLAVKCTNGIFVGKEHSGVVAYKGIPYVKPPVGDLRWRKPMEPDPSEKVFEAYNFSAILPQPDVFASELSSHPQSEDCLTLNIWRAKKAKNKLPVVVYFHGGDYSYGASANPLYDGENFVKEYSDIIFVSFNYRFGIFGMLDFSQVPGGEEYLDARNLVFYDQIASLKWLQKNIAAFGGDPEQITLMGDTSGGTCALFLPLISCTKGLFKRVISISSFPCLYSNVRLSQRLTARIQDYLHIHSMAEFKQLTEEQLVKTENKFFGKLNCPILEGLNSEDIFAAYANGAADGIEFIFGSNAEEFNSYTAYIGKEKSDYLSKIISDFVVSHIRQEDVSLYQQFMKLVNNDYKQFVNYLAVHAPLLRIARNHAASGNSARYFHWCVGSPIKEFGAFSAIEIPYILRTLGTAEKYTIVGDSYTGELLQTMLVQFIRGESPSLKGGMVQHNEPIDWPVIQETESPVLCFEKGATLDAGDIFKKAELIEKLVENNPNLQKEYFFYIDDEYSKLLNKDAD